MAKFLSNRQKNLKIGISSFTENETVLEVTGKVGIGTTLASKNLDVIGDVRIRGGIYDASNSSGTYNQVPVADGVGGWSWQPGGSGSGGIGGVTLREEGAVVGTAGSIYDINFKGNNIVVTSNVGTNIATVTVSDTPTFTSVSVSGNLDLDSTLTDVYNNVGIAGSVLISTGTGVSWTAPFAAGLQGLQGLQGTQGNQGLQGLQGTQGRQGLQGNQGLQGLQGTQGNQGLQGTQGTQGNQGLQGLQGTQGNQGLQGLQGTQGTQGNQGLQGLQGTQGNQGLQGLQGTQGNQGLQGLQGTQGNQGTQGLQGLQGTQGLQGDQGTQGTQGNQGLQGLQGTQGRQGLQGRQGTQGLQGTQGTQGLQGVAGPVGGSANQVIYKDGSNNPTGSANLTFDGTQLSVYDLNVTNNLSIGGTATVITAADLRVLDADIILGVTTNAQNQDVSTDTTANHGGIAVASTEGSPLVNLFIAGIETAPATYKKIMWFKSGAFSGLGTDAWLINYAVGIGSTQVPNGVRLSVGEIQLTDSNIKTQTVNASGIITASSFRPSSGYYQSSNGTNAFYVYDGTGNVAFQGTIGVGQINNASGYKALEFSDATTPTVLITNGLKVSGISTFDQNLELNSGLVDVNNLVGVAGSVLVSTGTGVSWTAPFAAGLQGNQGTQGVQGLQGNQGLQGLQGTQGNQGLQGLQGTQGNQGLQGLQGTQGNQGLQGLQGTQGNQGLQGLQGQQGTQGLQGLQGTQGNQGLQGLQGQQGTQGVQGLQGLQGQQGTQGVQGLQGLQGQQGTQGTQGLQGDQGTQGAQGLQGDQGTQGTQGLQGQQGTQGLQGLQGQQGTQGVQGLQGLQGQQGTQGVQGLQGLQGQQGTQGTQGLQGDQGTQGVQGLQGNQGLQGLQGRQGTQGLQGLQGNQGTQGTQGLQGLQGTQGLQGLQGTQGTQGVAGPVAGSANQVVYKDGSNNPAGSSNLTFDGTKLSTAELFVTGNVSIGGTLTYEDVTNIDAIGVVTARNGVRITSGGLVISSGIATFGSDIELDAGIKDFNNSVGIAGSILVSTGAGVSWTTPYAAGLQGVQGSQGIIGPQGRQGTQGLQGEQGTQGLQGLQGTQGVQGLQGLQGTQGNQGVQGLQGLQGTQGNQGLQGLQGTQGNQGVQGLQGIIGIGSTGAQGSQGTQGVQGLQGLQGTQGTQGLQGLQGTQATQGTQGLQGLQGTQGLQGLQGTQGVQGLQGLQGGNNGGFTVINDTTTNDFRYIAFEDVTSGISTNIGISSTKLTFNPFTGNLGIGTTTPTSKISVIGDILISGVTTSNDYDTTYTKTGSVVSTTTTTSAVEIHSTLSSSIYRSVEYTIQSSEGLNHQTTKILALHNGSIVNSSEYSTIYNNSSVSAFTLDISGGNIRLLATPASSSSTKFVVNFVAIKI